MFLFLFAVVLVVCASLIFVFTRDWNEDNAFPDDSPEGNETASGKKKTKSGIPKSSATEDDLPETDWIDALIAESPEQKKGKHEAEDMPWKQPPKEVSPLFLQREKPVSKVPKSPTTLKPFTEKKRPKQDSGSLKPFLPQEDDEEPRGSVPPLILILEVLCAFSVITAFITTIIAWVLQITQTRGL